MIRRALWLGGVGAFSSLGLYILMPVAIPADVAGAWRVLLPAYLLWQVFKPHLINRPWSRLLALCISFAVGQHAISIALPCLLPADWGMNPRDSISLAETALLVILAFAIPLALGTPSTIRTAARIGLVVVAMLPIHFACMKLIEVGIGTRWYSPSFSPYLFGLPEAVNRILLFAVLAPDHIAMQRAARARRWPLSCEKCAYNLTGNVSGVCPECGTALSESVRQRLQLRSADQRAAEQPSTIGVGTE